MSGPLQFAVIAFIVHVLWAFRIMFAVIGGWALYIGVVGAERP